MCSIFAFTMAKIKPEKVEINRIKAVLADKNRKNIWLAEKLNVSIVTVSKWCSNDTQPLLVTLLEISKLLEVDIRELLISTKQ